MSALLDVNGGLVTALGYIHVSDTRAIFGSCFVFCALRLSYCD